MSSLLVPFLYELRRRELRVGTTEVLELARGVALGLHGSTLHGFYLLARSLLVHRDADLDRFDQAFAAHFRGAESRAAELLSGIEDALQDPLALRTLAGNGNLEGVAGDGEPPEWLRELVGRRLDEEAERGDDVQAEVEDDRMGLEGAGRAGQRGRRGTARGASGAAGSGGRGQSAVGLADARRFRRYRSDLVLDVRQIEVALRRLRTFARDGLPEELDLDATVDATARAFGDLEVVLRPPKKSNVRVLLLMDVGGSMEPFARLCSQLFSAAKRASNLRELRTYYFHNIVYGRVFASDGSMSPVEIEDLLALVHRRWKLVLVGDASMAPGEMLSVGPWGSSWRRPDGGPMRGLDWLVALAERFDRSVWLNPDPPSYWVGGTPAIIEQVFQMYTLSLDGLADALSFLSRDTVGKRPEILGNPRNAL